MVDIFDAEEWGYHHPRGISIFDVKIMRITALHVAHDIGDGIRSAGFKDPMAMVMEEAPAMNPHIVELGVFAHVSKGLLEVLGVAVDPLALVAALGDGVELFRTEVTRESHAVE